MSPARLLPPLLALGLAIDAGRTGEESERFTVTVDEGTSMSVAVSPDGRTLAIDLQGGIWTLPAAGGRAARVTDAFSDARQPAWSPDGKWIAFFGYRDGGYDIWAVAPDGSGLHQLTSGPYDDREPAWSHDGTRLAFSSDRAREERPGSGDYDVWVLDLGRGQLRRVTHDPADDFMPTWSPDDVQIAFVSRRGGGQALWSVDLARGEGRRLTGPAVRADAPSWGPAGQIVYHAGEGEASRLELDGRPLTAGGERFRVSRELGLPARVLLHVGRQDQEADARRGSRDRRVHGHARGGPTTLPPPASGLRLGRLSPGPRHRGPVALAGRYEGRLRRGRGPLRDADRRQA